MSTMTTAAPVDMPIDSANLLNLSVPEMTVLVGGLRTIGASLCAPS